MFVCQNLELDVTGFYQVFFYEDCRIAKGRLCDTHTGLYRLFEGFFVIDDLHADPSPPALALTITGYPISAATFFAIVDIR